jgi:hypothetical protein
MQVRCFDCNRTDWMVKFHHEDNRSFCDGCYQKRIQPERLSPETPKGDAIVQTPWRHGEVAEMTTRLNNRIV